MDRNKRSTSNKTKQLANQSIAKLITILIFLGIILFSLKSCFSDNDKKGKYYKEDLPNNFSYQIKDFDNTPGQYIHNLDVVLNQKISLGQIATLSEELDNHKSNNHRLIIHFNIEGMNENADWATSILDENFEIDILGSTMEEDKKMLELSKMTKGKIIGIWKEEPLISSIFVLSEINGKQYIIQYLKNGESIKNEVISKKDKNNIVIRNVENISNGEYYIVNSNGNLEFLNKENEIFTTGYKLN